MAIGVVDQVVTGQLGIALGERVLSLWRAHERLGALETYPESGPGAADGRAAAEAVLRRALSSLGNREAYALARRLIDGETGIAAGSLESSLVLQDLAQAGLATWDVGMGSTEPTPLLRELLQFLETAVEEAAAQAEEQP